MSLLAPAHSGITRRFATGKTHSRMALRPSVQPSGRTGVVCAATDKDWHKVYLRNAFTASSYVKYFNELGKLVTPTGEEVAQAAHVVDKIAKEVQNMHGSVSVDRVVCGGSFGRCTYLRNDFEADLTVFLNDFDDRRPENLERRRDEVLRHLARHIPNAQLRQRTDGVRKQLVLQGVRVDVVMAPNVAQRTMGSKPQGQWEKLVRPVLETGRAEPDATVRLAHQRAVTEALNEVVDGLPPVAKEAARLFKAWVKLGLVEQGKLSSVAMPYSALETLVLCAYQKEAAGDASVAPYLVPKDKDGSLLLRTFLRSLDMCRRLGDPQTAQEPVMMCGPCESGNQYLCSKEEVLRFREYWGQPPYIIHPVHPQTNLAAVHPTKPINWDWAGLAREAGALLKTLQEENFEALMTKSALGQGVRAVQTL